MSIIHSYTHSHTPTHTYIYTHTQLGDVCVFRKKSNDWSIGRVLQFSKLNGKTKLSRQYKGLVAEVSTKNIGVACCWYALVEGSSTTYFLNLSKI